MEKESEEEVVAKDNKEKAEKDIEFGISKAACGRLLHNLVLPLLHDGAQVQFIFARAYLYDDGLLVEQVGHVYLVLAGPDVPIIGVTLTSIIVLALLARWRKKTSSFWRFKQ